ncbi:putative quinol monooxygenase [Sorangium sp. So ce1128]
MIVLCFRAKAKPERVNDVLATFQALAAPTRAAKGVLGIDIGRDIDDPNCFIGTERFVDRAALEHLDSLPEIKKVLDELRDMLAEPFDETLYEIASHEKSSLPT